MDKQEILLAALAAGGTDVTFSPVTFSPVQMQKLLFLIDREAPELAGKTHFNFKPYNYGPFDRAVYEELELLSNDELVKQIGTGRYPKYILTPEGYEAGKNQLEQLSEKTSSFMKDTAKWVRKLTFQELITEIYDRYPKMKKNSVFSQ